MLRAFPAACCDQSGSPGGTKCARRRPTPGRAPGGGHPRPLRRPPPSGRPPRAREPALRRRPPTPAPVPTPAGTHRSRVHRVGDLPQLRLRRPGKPSGDGQEVDGVGDPPGAVEERGQESRMHGRGQRVAVRTVQQGVNPLGILVGEHDGVRGEGDHPRVPRVRRPDDRRAPVSLRKAPAGGLVQNLAQRLPHEFPRVPGRPPTSSPRLRPETRNHTGDSGTEPGGETPKPPATMGRGRSGWWARTVSNCRHLRCKFGPERCAAPHSQAACSVKNRARPPRSNAVDVSDGCQPTRRPPALHVTR